MSKMFTAQQAADELGVPARALRRHLRLSESWKSAGFGGRYLFTETDIRALRREMTQRPARPVRAPRKETTPSLLPDLIPAGTEPEALGTKRTRSAREAVEGRFAARQARLLDRLQEIAREEELAI